MKQTAIFLLAVLLLSLFAGCASSGAVPTAPAAQEPAYSQHEPGGASAPPQTAAPVNPDSPPETVPFTEPALPVTPDTPAFSEPTLQDLVGSYALVSLNGKDIKSTLLELYGEEEFEEFLEYFGVTEDNLDEIMKLTLRADGTCTIEELSESVDCAWTLEGSTVFLTYDGETISATWSNGILSIEVGDEYDDVQTEEFRKIN